MTEDRVKWLDMEIRLATALLREPEHMAAGGRFRAALAELTQLAMLGVDRADLVILRCRSAITAHGVRCALVEGHEGGHRFNGTTWEDLTHADK